MPTKTKQRNAVIYNEDKLLQIVYNIDNFEAYANSIFIKDANYFTLAVVPNTYLIIIKFEEHENS